MEKNWLPYISEGAHYQLNTSAETNFISSKNRKKQLANVSANSAQIIDAMKRQNLNSETLHKLLVQTTNSTSSLIPQLSKNNNPYPMNKANKQQLL